ncbi:MAG TPA: lytic transglycosylase domain-containing protein [Acidobacteriaceae bacterium]|jgi:soluble lytic murein transglycosylase-like protein|nr:lytic transglycosylase domain-containing protein [Acidobacteriaceae bacterium]
MLRLSWGFWCVWLALASLGGAAHAADYVRLRNGFDMVCDHQATVDGKVRLYMDAAGTNFLEVDASEIVSSEPVTVPRADPAKAPAPVAAPMTAKLPEPAKLSEAEMKPLLSAAGARYDLDVDLLASVIRQESGGQIHAVSRAGAQGLMQLMPKTASDLGVANSFVPGQNVQGGTEYLNSLLRRYDDHLTLALAAYNAGPAAVDRWHGIPPYAETQAYVARVIHEYNRRYELRRRAELRSSPAPQAAR